MNQQEENSNSREQCENITLYSRHICLFVKVFKKSKLLKDESLSNVAVKYSELQVASENYLSGGFL